MPQHCTAPPEVTAQVWAEAAATATAPLASPLTGTGAARCVVVPSPICPEALRPQHHTAPPLVTAQVWPLPAATASTPLASPLTGTGVSRCVVVPSPTWPYPLYPQHCTPPPLVSAQVWLLPAITDTTPLSSPLTGTGITCVVVVPSPSWPEPLYPQHCAPPLLVSPQV